MLHSHAKYQKSSKTFEQVYFYQKHLKICSHNRTSQIHILLVESFHLRCHLTYLWPNIPWSLKTFGRGRGVQKSQGLAGAGAPIGLCWSYLHGRCKMFWNEWEIKYLIFSFQIWSFLYILKIGQFFNSFWVQNRP